MQSIVVKTPRHDLLMVIGDLNAKVGSERNGREEAIGTEGIGETNENGERFIDFCLNHSLVIGGTQFPHENVHKSTWSLRMAEHPTKLTT